MPKLSELLADRASITVALDLGDVAVTYRPQVVTPAWQAAIVEAERASDLEGSLYRPLVAAVISWDLERDDGTTYELTPEGLAEVPKVVLQSVLLGVLLAARPDPQTLARSSDGSRARAS